MKRRLFNGLSALSLVLCAAAMVMWARSQYRQDFLFWSAFDQPKIHQTSFDITSNKSELNLTFAKFDYGPGRKLMPSVLAEGGWTISSMAASSWTVHPARCWATYRTQTLQYMAESDDVNPKTVEAWSVGARFWILGLFLAVLPTTWLVLRMLRKDIRPGHCPKCGYDLRATPERCPECGMISVKQV